MEPPYPVLAPLPAFPLPLIAAAALAFLLLRAVLRGAAPGVALAVLAVCATQNLLVALTQHYGFQQLIPVQVIGAFVIPPLVWVAFRRMALSGPEPAREAAHLLWPGFGFFCLLLAQEAVDIALILGFVAYGGAILLSLRARADELPRAALAFGRAPATLWRIAGIALILSAVTDMLISYDLLYGAGTWRGWSISLFNTTVLLTLGALSVSEALESATADPAEPPAPDGAEKDPALLARLDGLMRETRLYLDPDLTLARLARRLGVPAKALSAAINRSTGENVSRYVNGLRVRAACAALEAGDSVTEAMLKSGFATKSNFNREFLRVTGSAPSKWAASSGQPPDHMVEQ